MLLLTESIPGGKNTGRVEVDSSSPIRSYDKIDIRCFRTSLHVCRRYGHYGV